MIYFLKPYKVTKNVIFGPIDHVMIGDYMSDENKSVDSTENPIENLKAEMSRKLGNTENQMADLKRTNELLLAKLNQMTAKPAPAPAAREELSELLYKDPERYAELIAERANARINESMTKQNRVNGIIGGLTAEYPELTDANHELTRKAIEIYNSLPAEEQNSSLAYKMAVREAADQVGVKPKSKRPVAEEPSFGGYNARGQRTGKSTKLTEDQETLAAIWGVDTSNAEVKARLLANQNRDWGTPRAVTYKGKK